MRPSIAALALTVTAVLGASVLSQAPADAASLGVPTGMHVSAATSTSFTVSLNKASKATGYRVYTARSVAALYVRNITSATKHATSSRPVVTLGGYRYSSAINYYRVETLAGSSHRWEASIHFAGLKAPAPTGVTASATSTGSTVRWAAQATGSGFLVAQATNATMTTDRVNRSVGAGNYVFTPYGLTKGRTYYFRVQARNAATGSSWSAMVTLVPRATQTALKTMTYNLLSNSFDGASEGGQRVAPWSSRRTAAAALIREGQPDLLGVQEASGWVGAKTGAGGTRQVDDLLKLLPGYALAKTEAAPGQPGWFRTGVYVLYRTAAVRTVGAGGHWSIGDTRWAAYQLFAARSTGAKVFFVTAHLYGGSGRKYDDVRSRETASLVSQATSAGRADGAPVVYAGDFNSNTSSASHAYDASTRTMQGNAIVDTRRVAITRYNEKYNSANQYMRSAPTGGYSIDYVYASPTVAVRSWGVLLHLSHGKFIGTMGSDHNPVWAVVSVAS